MLNFPDVRAEDPHVGAGCTKRKRGDLARLMKEGAINSEEGGVPARRPDGRLRVLLANEPRSYRESIAAVFRQLRPDVDVEVAEPEALESSVSRLLPDVAICSRVTGGVRELVPVWVELYPGHSTRSVASERGKRTEYAEIQLGDLLSIVDRAAGGLAQSG